MGSETKQKQAKCRTCGKRTLHVKHIKKQDMGCGFIAGNLFLSVLTLGLWLPIFILLLGLGMFSNSLAPLAARWHCQVCGRKK